MNPSHLFVYGTLQPGEVRWQHLSPFVTGDGQPTTTAGQLFDTGLDYPAAMFDRAGLIKGRLYELRAESLAAALAHLDDVEGAVRGLYHRVVVTTAEGREAWAYQCGDDSLLVRRLEHGDWTMRETGLCEKGLS